MNVFKLFRMESIFKNKVTKYIIYAFGEIVLIFIGINLAIWFNNWNANEKQILEEIQILKELKTGLSSDLIYIDYIIELNQEAEKSCEIILNHIEKSIPYNASLDRYFANVCGYGVMFPKIGAYESLKSKGIGLISSDSLRIMLGNFYETQIPYLYLGQKINAENFNIFKELYKNKFHNWISLKTATPNNYELLIKDNYFKEQIRYTMNFKKLEVISLSVGKNDIVSIIELIDYELNRLN